ncbi:hypothetical protein ACSSS7_003602 [Eimeria intestinalis]
MVRAAGFLLLFFAASFETLFHFQLIILASPEPVVLPSIPSYISPFLLSHSADRLQLSVDSHTSHTTGLLDAKRRSAKAASVGGVHALRRSSKQVQNPPLHETRKGALRATSGREGVALSQPPNPPWAHHLLGVWHAYLPNAVSAAFDSAADATLPKPLPLWITEDAAIACPDLKVTLRMSSPAPGASELELRGLLAHSASPPIRLWDNRVELSAAVLAGAVSLRRLERDCSGRVVLSGVGEEASKAFSSKGSDKRESHAATASTYMGNFTAYRVLGEDQNEL